MRGTHSPANLERDPAHKDERTCKWPVEIWSPRASRSIRVVHVSDRTGPVGGRCCVLTSAVVLGGCERVPSVNLLGAFFPSWMLCVIIGIALTLAARHVLVLAGLDVWLAPRGLIYPALAVALTLGTWLAFFKG